MKASSTLLYLIAVLIGLSAAFLTFPISASEYEHKSNYTTISNYTSIKTATGLALTAGLAAIDCDYTTRSWQAGVGIGFFDGIGAPVVGGCKKFDSFLFKATIGREDETTAGNVGFMFTFN